MISKDIRIISACNQEWEGQTHCDNLSFSGVGKVNATIHTMKIIRVHKPKLIINYGTGASKFFKGELVDCNKFIQGSKSYTKDVNIALYNTYKNKVSEDSNKIT